MSEETPVYMTDGERTILVTALLRMAFTIEGYVTLNPDGTITPEPGYTPDAAATAFWEAVRAMSPMWKVE